MGARQVRPGVLEHLHEDRLKRDIALGLLRQYGHLGRLVGEKKAAIEESQDAVVMLLLVTIDERMVVTLAASQVHAKEDAADVPGNDVGLALAVEKETGGRAHLRIAAVRGEDFRDQAIVRLVSGAGSLKIVQPGGPLDMLVGAAIHEQDVKRRGRMADVAVAL